MRMPFTYVYQRRVMRIICLIAHCLIAGVTTTHAQEDTYSKFVDFDIGNGNYPIDILNYDGGFIIVSLHICGDSSQCTVVSRFNSYGEQLEVMTIPDFYVGNIDPVSIDEGNIRLSTNQTEPLEKASFAMIDIGGWDHQVKSYDYDIGYIDHMINSGMIRIDSVYWTYGGIYNLNHGDYNTYITGWTNDFDTIEQHMEFDPDQLGQVIYDVGLSGSNDLLLFSRFRISANGYRYEINVLGSEFSLTELYSFFEAYRITPVMYIDPLDNIYFASQRHPEISFPPSFGRLNKLNRVTNELEWTLELPLGLSVWRQFYINDIIQTESGDIVFCGDVEDVESTGAASTGFVGSISEEGELNWLRIFKAEKVAPKDTFDLYRRAKLRKVIEAENGNIVCLGYSYRDEDQGSPYLELWLLSLTEDGCLDGDTCGEINILSKQKNVPREVRKTKVFPNPTREGIYFTIDKEHAYQIFDMRMAPVGSGYTQGYIDTSPLPPGMYFLRLVDDTGVYSVSKFVKID